MHAPAAKLLQVYAREQNREMLRDFYYSDDRRVDSAVLVLEEARGMVVSVISGFWILFYMFYMFFMLCFVFLGTNGGCVDDSSFLPLFRTLMRRLRL